MSETLLATKIRIPPVHRNLVSRPQLIQRLNDGIAQEARLILISAPAGYGKSTLLSEWVSQLGSPVAWLSLEKGENNPARFWSYLVAALDTIPHLRQAGIGEAILQAMGSPQPASMEALLTDLVNDLAALEAEAVLVLDDLQVITESQIHQDLVFLVEHLPQSGERLHLVVANRRDPPWPLARWRGGDQLVEIRAADLRFNPEEAADFLNRVMKLGPRFSPIVSSEFARTSCRRCTMSGRIESLQGSKKTETLAMAKLMANTKGSPGCAATATVRTSPARTRSATIIRRRLLKRSMTTPAKAPRRT